MGSSRLPGKHLRPVGGKPVLFYLVDRIKSVFDGAMADDRLVVALATSTEPGNEEFKGALSGRCEVCFGEPQNIPKRHLQAAQSLVADSVLSIDGDDILCARDAMYAVWEALQGGADYVRTEGLPLGMNACGYTVEFLRQSLANHADSILEVGWERVFDRGRLKTIAFPPVPGQDDLRMTLDYPEDLAFFRTVLEALGERVVSTPDQELIQEILRNEWWRLNSSLTQEYWRNYNAQKTQEKTLQGSE